MSFILFATGGVPPLSEPDQVDRLL